VSAVAERRCEACGGRLASTSRRDRRFCSARCRQLAYDRRSRALRTETQTIPVSQPDEQLLRRALEAATQEERLLAQIAAAANRGAWRAAAWILERRFPERWAAGRRPEETLVLDESDPFAEVDELARRRRKRLELS
jgi:endogenous inhibitor of DNA gyrase (YacG/DUF329 family)